MSKYSLKEYFLKERSTYSGLDLDLIKKLDVNLTNNINVSFNVSFNEFGNVNISNINKDSFLDLLFLLKEYDKVSFNNLLQKELKKSKSILKDKDINEIIDLYNDIKNYKINESKTLKSIIFENNLDTLKALMTKFNSHFNIAIDFLNMPVDNSLEKTIKNVANAKNRDEFKKRMIICLKQACNFHKTEYLIRDLQKVSDLINDAEVVVRNNNQQQQQYFKSKLKEVSKKIIDLQGLLEKFSEEENILIESMSNNSSFKEFFTSQGPKVGYLLEDILSSVYNNSVIQNLSIGSNSTKWYALSFCLVLLNQLNSAVGNNNDIINTNKNYKKALSYFISNSLSNESKTKIETNLKSNINKIADFKDSYIFDVDNLLSKNNSAFDFIISDKKDSLTEKDKIVVFDLKSSHNLSSGTSAKRTASGSNLNNYATNELIDLSDISGNNIIIDPDSKTKSDYNKSSNKQKNFSIFCTALVKLTWEISSSFNIKKAESSFTSLYGATLNSASENSLNFHIDDKRQDDYVKPLVNKDLFNVIEAENIEKFKSYVRKDKENNNFIVKGSRENVDGIKFFIDNFSSDFKTENGYFEIQGRRRTKEDFERLKILIKRYMETNQKSFENFKNENQSQNNNIEKSLFSDQNKLRFLVDICKLLLPGDKDIKRNKLVDYFANNVNPKAERSPDTNRDGRNLIKLCKFDHKTNFDNNNIKSKIINLPDPLPSRVTGENIRDFKKSIENFITSQKDIEIQTQHDSYLDDVVESYKSKEKSLKEIYYHLFKKKIVKEGGLGGHMRHPYENLDVTPREMMDRIESYGVPQTVIDKVDGQNLFFTVDRDGTLLFARNKQDMTHQDLVDKFTGHGAEAAFLEGGEAIKRGVEQWLGTAGNFADQEVLDIFHPTEDIRSFINFEIMHPKNSNQIQYDKKYIVFHSIVDFGEGRSKIFSSNQDDRLKKLISLMNAGVSSTGFELASNREIDLNTLSNVQIMSYTNRVRELIEALDMKEDEFLADGILRIIDEELSQEGVNLEENTLKIMRDFVLYGEDGAGDAITSRDFTKHISKEDTKTLRALGLTSATKAKAKVAKILSPFKEIFVDLGIDLLKGVDSAYLSSEQSKENITGLRDKLQTAIEDYDQYIMSTPEDELSKIALRLKPHVDKIKQVGIDKAVSTSVEGGVYTQDLDLEKITGGFAPLNQIVGAAYRDKEGIFPNFQDKFSMNENKRYSLKSVFNLDD